MKLEILAHGCSGIRRGHGAALPLSYAPASGASARDSRDFRMQQLIELAPLIAFFLVWKFSDIYMATAVLMGAMLLLVAWDWFRTRTVPKMHLLSAVLVWVFGAATLILHDVRFIQLKATVFYWLVALVLGGSIWIGRITVLERLMGGSIPENHKVPPSTWRNVSLASALFYAALGAANLWVAHTMSEQNWVFFKTWITVPLVFVFTGGLMFWLLRGYESKDEPKDEPKAL
jgi:intracellular septation protein